MTTDSKGGSRPVPDPTQLTTDAIMREVGAVEDKLRAAKDLFDEKVAKERELREKDVEAINRELTLLDKQRTESKKSDADALAAALSAAKEAVQQNNLNFEKAITKTENATNDLIKSLGEQFSTTIASVGNTISDLKERVSKVENTEATHLGRTSGGASTMVWGFLALTATIGVIGILISVVEMFVR